CRTKYEHDPPVESARRQSHPPPPERELVCHYSAYHFDRENYSIRCPGAARKTVERQHSPGGEEQQQTELDHFLEALPCCRPVAARRAVQPQDCTPAEKSDRGERVQPSQKDQQCLS